MQLGLKGRHLKRSLPSSLAPNFIKTPFGAVYTWPPIPIDKEEAGRFIDAYACLKLEMDRLKKHEDELDFFALELQSRRVLLGIWNAVSRLRSTGFCRDCGRSYFRPLWALCTVTALGSLPLLVIRLAVTPWQSLGLSLVNTFNVFRLPQGLFRSAPY